MLRCLGAPMGRRAALIVLLLLVQGAGWMQAATLGTGPVNDGAAGAGRVFAAHADGRVRAWEPDGTLAGELRGHDGGVTAQVSTPQGDYRLHSDYLIAADGARSSLRELLGLQLRGTSYEGRYLIADIKLDSAYPTERRAFFDPRSNPGS